MSCPQRVGGIVALQLTNPGTQWSLVSAGIYQLPHQDAAGVLWRRHKRPTKEERAIFSDPSAFCNSCGCNRPGAMSDEGE